MDKHIIYLIATVCFTISCNLNPTKTPGTAERPENEAAPGPPAQELLDALQGRWQSLQDSSIVIEFNDDLLIRYRGSAIQEQEKIAVFTDCISASCVTDSLTASEGWCFMEIKKSVRQCNQILGCDTSTLRYRVLDNDKTIFYFKKI
ncbi:MAG: hypothetical protein IPK76_26855 [Lewinellaceae bacterium]|nr:hypothetical protein [Lewinellaceae bacterium]